jgi:hypothetical protein
MMSREEVEAYLKRTGLQLYVASAVNSTLLTRSDNPVQAMIRALQLNHDAEGIRTVTASVIIIDSRTLGVDVAVSSKLSSGRGVVRLEGGWQPSRATSKELESTITEWEASAQQALQAADPVDQAKVDELVMAMPQGLAAALHAAGGGNALATNPTVAIVKALSIAVSIACLKLGAKHAQLPLHLHLRCLLLGKNSRQVSAALFVSTPGAPSSEGIDTALRAPSIVVDSVLGGTLAPSSWLALESIGVAIGTDGKSTDNTKSLIYHAADVHQSITSLAASRSVGSPCNDGSVSVHLGLAHGRAPNIDDAIRLVADGTNAATTFNKADKSSNTTVSLAVNFGGYHLHLSVEAVAKEKAEAEAAALAASTAKGKGKAPATAAAGKAPAGKAAKDKSAPTPTATPVAPWAVDPSSVSINSESEDGSSLYELNMNRVRAAAIGNALDQGVAATPAPVASVTSPKPKAGAVAVDSEVDPAHNAKQQISHVKLHYFVQEMLAAHKASLEVGKRGRDLVIDIFGDTDDVAWKRLTTRDPADTALYISGRFSRLLAARLAAQAVAAVESSNASAFRYGGAADALQKEHDCVYTADGGAFSLDWLFSISALLQACRPFFVADRAIVLYKSSVLSACEDLEAEIALAAHASVFVIRSGVSGGAAWTLQSLSNGLAASNAAAT